MEMVLLLHGSYGDSDDKKIKRTSKAYLAADMQMLVSDVVLNSASSWDC
jgi:hypothetical protein